MFQAKFMMMSDIGYTLKIVLEPLMEPMCQLKFLYKNKYYISRKRTHSQNVIDVCDFRICFTFVWAGWEGIAHNTHFFFFFWKLFERKNCDFYTLLEICI